MNDGVYKESAGKKLLETLKKLSLKIYARHIM